MSAIPDHLAALRQFLLDPRLWSVVIRCVLLSALAFLALWAGLGWVLQHFSEHAGAWSTVLTWGGWLGSLVAAVLLFPALFGIIGGFFYESVARAVDARHRPPLPPALEVPVMASLVNGLKYFVLLVVLNGLALPVYLPLLWVAGAGAVLYVLVNGVLLAREQFDAVALRRLPPASARAWRRAHRGLLLRYGIVTAALGLIPFLNLVAPLLGAAAMTRMVNRALLPRPGPPPL